MKTMFKMMLAGCRASSLYRQALLLNALQTAMIVTFTVQFGWLGFAGGMLLGLAQNLSHGLTKAGKAEVERASQEWGKAIDAMMSVRS